MARDKTTTAMDGTYPRLENWRIFPYMGVEIASGQIHNDTRWKDGTTIYTSAILNVDLDEYLMETRNTFYRLGSAAPMHRIEDPND
jgi:hypothetical protein